jgi:hypothetical protein
MFPCRIALSLIGVVGVSALMACSQTDVSRTPATSEVSSREGGAAQAMQDQSPSSESAIKAYIDPTTGELREPTAEELSVDAARTNKKPLSAVPIVTEQSTPQEVVHPGGVVEVPLDQSKQQGLQACIQKDGSMNMGHECESDSKIPVQEAKP